MPPVKWLRDCANRSAENWSTEMATISFGAGRGDAGAVAVAWVCASTGAAEARSRAAASMTGDFIDDPWCGGQASLWNADPQETRRPHDSLVLPDDDGSGVL